MTKFRAGILFALFAALSAAADAKLYKWVDDQGETHYGEVVPPEYASKPTVEIDKGRQVNKASDSSDSAPPNTAEQQSAIDQHRHDKALLNTYSSEQEIDLARDRNLRQVDALINSIRVMQKAAQENLDSYNQEAARAKQAGKPVPASLSADIANAQRKIESLKHDLEAAQNKGASVKASFEADKVRYRQITSGNN
jgi:Domain of unknown function (DUF4124)